ncbi:hypothetical protein [Curtobacterium sp. MCBD17_026]|nr:hypothetical protein [Curtobacterium sp. MCBD17_026]WIB72620.1 hypothetical protein DEI85_17380 [Curtobacterium sp. MCBD17_026]
MAVKVKATIRSTETRELEAEGESYEAARAALDAQVPDGWQLTGYRTDK